MSPKPGSKARNLGKEDRNRYSRNKGRGSFESRETRTTFLIVCEGEKTEPNYFKDFKAALRASTVRIQVEGTGMNTLSLVEEALRIKDKNSVDYDQVWCVFDKDDFMQQQVVQAFDLAKKNGIEIAYSNECFELWYVLHFQAQISALKRDQLCKQVTVLFHENFKENYPRKNKGNEGRKYDKADKGIYDLLKDRQTTAIHNAKQLLANANYQDGPCASPGTTVYKLVEELNKLRRD